MERVWTVAFASYDGKWESLGVVGTPHEQYLGEMARTLGTERLFYVYKEE